MKVVIAGSREITDYQLFVNALNNEINDKNIDITEVVCGMATGRYHSRPDTLGDQWAKENEIPVKYFPALWSTYGRAARSIRNKQMAEYADAAIVIWNGKSAGSRNMINHMKLLNKPCYPVEVI